MQKVFELFNEFAHRILSKEHHRDESYLTKARALIILWCSTTLVMWLYVLYSYLSFGWNPVAIGGLFCTILHTLSPYLFYKTQNFTITGLNISLTGLGFQVLFCIYSGGIFSPAAIWLTLHPVILGFFGNRKLILFSVLLNFVLVLGLYLAGAWNMLPADSLPPLFRDGMIISSFIGLDLLVAAFTVGAMKLNDDKTKELRMNKELIENLVRVLCHDINNPLTIIKLAGRKLNPEDLSQNPIHAQRVLKASDDIQKITESVRMWMANQDGKLELCKEIISIPEIIEHINHSFHERLVEKNISINLNDLTNDNTMIYADRSALLYQVINNLISNAIKFSFENSKIDVTFKDIDHELVIEVRDYGVGIDNEIIDLVFSPYAKTSHKGTKNEQGTGFGLPIVATLIEKMSGTIKILNMKNDKTSPIPGTKVAVQLPLVPNEDIL